MIIKKLFKLYHTFPGKHSFNTFFTLSVPLVTVAVEPKGDELVCVPKVEEIRTIISRCFDKILRVPKHIPRIESVLFPEFKGAFYMFPVFRKEEQVSIYNY